MTEFSNAMAIFDHLLEYSSEDMFAGLNLLEELDEKEHIKVKALIEAHLQAKQATQFNHLILSQCDALKLQKDLHNLEGKCISHFVLKKFINAGGMGSVYLANRVDGKIQQQVAIKILHSSVMTLFDKAHMLREAKYLAQLTHPGIAQVIDVGESQFGVYIIMHFVSEETLLTFCDKYVLSTESRLDLFIQICEAVSYAHSNQVIHADIKPDNIVMSELGKPVLIDFGVARYIHNEKSEKDFQHYFQALTHGYASPEHIKGDSLTTHSDIYSLGRVLEGLLSRPVKVELQAIINKATACLPEERFGSVDELKKAVESYIYCYPLLWYEHSLIYRLKKFCRRSPFAAAFIAVSFLSLNALVAGIYIYQSEQLISMQQQNQVLDFYRQLLVTSSDKAAKGSKLSAAALLEQGAYQLSLSELNDENQQSVLYTLASSLFIHGNFVECLRVLDIMVPSPEVYVLSIHAHLQLEKKDEATVIYNLFINRYPWHEQLPELKWMTKNTFSSEETQELKDFLNTDSSFRLVKALYLVRDKHDDLAQYAFTKLAKSRIVKPAEKVWVNLIHLEWESGLSNVQISQKISEVLDEAVNIYHPLHPELGRLHFEASKLFKKIGYIGLQKRALNKGRSIYQQLSPNFDYALEKVLLALRDFYLKHQKYTQANNFNNQLLELCFEYSGFCKERLYFQVLLQSKLRNFKQVIESAERWLEIGSTSIMGEHYHTLLLFYFKALIEESRRVSSSLFFSEPFLYGLSNKQLVTWLDLAIKSRLIEQLNQDHLDYLVEQASQDAELAHTVSASSEELPVSLNFNASSSLVALANQFHNTHVFQLPSGSRQVQENKRVNSIEFPKNGSQLVIGEKVNVTWDPKKLPGDTINIHVNHTKHFDVSDFNHFDNIRSIDWHLVEQGIKNNGQFTLDPFDLMVNGALGFKLMLVSEKGFWSLSDGLFSVASGKAKDNGLEHWLSPSQLTQSITKPLAYDVLHIGNKYQVIWDPLKLLGNEITLYVLHDDPKGIGDKQRVNIEAVLNKRWYLVMQHIPNSGSFKLDPALFNGRGSNYKLLMVTDQGYWSVSDRRFSIVNPL